jgi:hypothetical protein
MFNPLTPELNPSAQRCLQRFFNGKLNFEKFTARRLHKSFGVKGFEPQIICKKLTTTDNVAKQIPVTALSNAWVCGRLLGL